MIRTDALQPGMRVRIGSRLVRTVASVGHSSYVNCRDEPILTVRYIEPSSAQWSNGNTASASSLWTLDSTDR